MGDVAEMLYDKELQTWEAHLLGMCGEYGICQYCEYEEKNTMQGQIQKANPSKSGKTLSVQVNGQWYSTKHFELENYVGETITFQTSESEFNGTVMHWLNDYTLAGQDQTPAAQAFNQQFAQNQGQTAPQTDKDLTITALALVKCIEGIKTPQQAYEHFNEVKRLLSGKANPQMPEGYMEGHDQEIPF